MLPVLQQGSPRQQKDVSPLVRQPTKKTEPGSPIALPSIAPNKLRGANALRTVDQEQISKQIIEQPTKGLVRRQSPETQRRLKKRADSVDLSGQQQVPKSRSQSRK